jgi:hypothetical protein
MSMGGDAQVIQLTMQCVNSPGYCTPGGLERLVHCLYQAVSFRLFITRVRARNPNTYNQQT